MLDKEDLEQSIFWTLWIIHKRKEAKLSTEPLEEVLSDLYDEHRRRFHDFQN